MEIALLSGIFGAAFLSATLLFGLSELSLIATLQLGTADHWALFLAATSGNVLGAVANFVLGRFLLRFEDRRWFPVRAAHRQKAEALFARHGQPVLLLSWLPVIGDPLTLVAGLLRMPPATFLLYVTLGKAARYAVLIWLFA